MPQQRIPHDFLCGVFLLCIIVCSTCLFLWCDPSSPLNRKTESETKYGSVLIYKLINHERKPDRAVFPHLSYPLVPPKICSVYQRVTNYIDVTDCLNLTTGKGPTPICIYPPEVDIHISKSIAEHRVWEGQMSKSFEYLLSLDPYLNVIDIGANIGVYSLIAAKWNRKAVAVEANLDHVTKLYQSVQLGNFENFVTVVHNAVSDCRMTVRLLVDMKNRGHSFIPNPTVNDTSEFKGHSITQEVRTILMDDLLEVVNFRRAILKIDIEGHEPQAFKYARELFYLVDIPYVFMEWNFVKRSPEGDAVYRFFRERGYRAFSEPFFWPPLYGSYENWPFNILWKKVANASLQGP